ncbi:MAG: ABC transporter ATP-binding protein [Candidatus Rokubacteria bacterium]|nr:ABC transporter ATP-binding protein [Candidatus Rokubacteria bacterium]
MPYLDVVGLAKRFGPALAVAEVTFSVDKGELVTLLGPSGCGKTTTMRCIAGLEAPDAGEIRIDGETVTSVARGLFTLPERRGLGMVFQSYALWPHMTVFDNVAYGLKARKLPRREAAERTAEALRLVELDELRGRHPAELSGGQQQRVALARALAYQPKLLLLDEPLSNLDAKLRERMRDELRRLFHRVGITAIYVTHDQIEALTISDRVIVMSAGRIRQEGRPRELYARPVDRFVAQFIGAANVLEATVAVAADGGRVGRLAADVAEGPLRLGRPVPGEGGDGGPVLLCIRPEHLRLDRTRPAAANVLRCQVDGVLFQGNLTIVQLRAGSRVLQAQSPADFSAEVGETLFVSVDPEHICLIADDAR